MRHYRRTYSGGARVKKIMFRILFVILAAAVITFSTILLGTYLQKKVDEAEAERNISSPSTEQITSRPERNDGEAANRNVTAAGVILRNYRSADAVTREIDALANYYNTLMLDLSDEGALLYTSPAVCKATHIAIPEEDDSLALVRTALDTAKAKNFVLCAVMDASFGKLERGVDETVDGALFAELASFGVDEILIKNLIFDPEDPPADEIADYLNRCAEIVDGACALGVLFPGEVFLNFSNARNIQIIASAADFTGIDLTSYASVTPDELYEQTKKDASSLYGSFSIYNMRVVLATPDIANLAAQEQALQDSAIGNLCFLSPVLPYELVYERPGNVPEETAETEPAADVPHVPSQENPYASGGGNASDTDENGG